MKVVAYFSDITTSLSFHLCPSSLTRLSSPAHCQGIRLRWNFIVDTGPASAEEHVSSQSSGKHQNYSTNWN